MNKRKILLFLMILFSADLTALQGDNTVLIETKNTVMVFTGQKEGKFIFQYRQYSDVRRIPDDSRHTG